MLANFYKQADITEPNKTVIQPACKLDNVPVLCPWIPLRQMGEYSTDESQPTV